MRCVLLTTLRTGLIQNFLGMVMGGEHMEYTCLVTWITDILIRIFPRLEPDRQLMWRILLTTLLTGLIQNFLGMVMGGELMEYTCLVTWVTAAA